MLGKTIPKQTLLEYLDTHDELIDFTLDLSLKTHQPQSWRATWLIKLSCKKNDPTILPHVDALIAAIDDREDGHQRELLNIIAKMDWTETQEGLLFEKCLTLCGDVRKSPSVRMVAFRMISRIVASYPELWHEIQYIIQEDYLDTLSAGIRSGFKKELAALSKLVLPKL